MAILVADLPEVTRNRLLAALNKPPAETVVFDETHLLRAVIGAVTSICGLGFVISGANGYKWPVNDQLFFLATTIACLTVGWASIKYLTDWRRSDFKRRSLVNPLYFLRFRFNRLEAYPLGPKTEWHFRHHTDSRGAYRGTTFTFRSETAERSFHIASSRVAGDLIQALEHRPSLLADLLQRQDTAAMYEFDLLYEWRLQQFPRAEKASRSFLAHLARRTAPYAFAGLVAVVLFYGATVPYNDYRDDQLRWQTAISTNTANAYRLYVASRPDGRFVSKAHAEIDNLYEEAANKYQASAGAASSPGIEAVIKILDYARRSGRYRVFVRFSADNEIPSDIEDRVRKFEGVSQVIPILPSFSPTMNQAREARILERISSSFGKVIPGDILQFIGGNPSARDVAFDVGYKILPSGELYYREKQEHIPEQQRDWYTGISFNWKFAIAIPDAESSTFQLSLDSEPAQLFQVASEQTSAEGSTLSASEVYDGMADSAFDNFASKLLSDLSVK